MSVKIEWRCSNCGRAMKSKPEPYKLFKQGCRATGVGYCPDCVKTWKERNGAEFDEEYADPERLFVTWFCDEMACTIEFQRELLERYAQE